MVLRDTAVRELGTKSLDEEVVIDEVSVRGAVPEWLSGTLLRNGPARFEAGENVRHWFDGFAMLHRFSFAEGKVAYANRFLRTKALDAAREGRIGYREFASDPCRTLFRRLSSLFVDTDMSDNAFINVARLGDEFIAMSETPLPVVFDPGTLETLGLDEHPPGQLPTAHPHFDRDGTMVNFAVHLSARSHYRLYTRGTDGSQRQIASVGAQQPAYLHSFGLTERFVVLALGPLTVQPMRLALGGRPFIENYRWRPQHGTEFIAIDRRSGKTVQRWQGEPAFLFHHINAFEDGDQIVVDLCGYPDTKLIADLYLDRLRAGADIAEARPRRYRLDLRGGDAEYEVLADVELELPRINPRLDGAPYGVAWGTSRTEATRFGDALVRLDVNTGDAVQWHEPGSFPGEPVFVPRPGAAGEDDGVVLSVVLDAERERSCLLVLDAGSMTEIARAEVPHHIPFGIHGQFYDELHASNGAVGVEPAAVFT